MLISFLFLTDSIEACFELLEILSVWRQKGSPSSYSPPPREELKNGAKGNKEFEIIEIFIRQFRSNTALIVIVWLLNGFEVQ